MKIHSRSVLRDVKLNERAFHFDRSKKVAQMENKKKFNKHELWSMASFKKR